MLCVSILSTIYNMQKMWENSFQGEKTFNIVTIFHHKAVVKRTIWNNRELSKRRESKKRIQEENPRKSKKRILEENPRESKNCQKNYLELPVYVNSPSLFLQNAVLFCLVRAQNVLHQSVTSLN